MALDFEPEIEETLKARFAEALEPVYDAAKVMSGGQRPGQLRKHVFDSFDGSRLIVSRDRMPDGEMVLHVSVSFRDEAPKGPEMLVMVIEKVNALRGYVPGPIRAFASNEGVVHMIFPEVPEKLKGAVFPANPKWN
jgi:hypothetical protein